MSTTRSQLYRLARDLGNIEAFEHGYKRSGLSGGVEGEAERYARRAIYREGNRQINHAVRAVGLGPFRH
jgi:hypothetical protein